MKKIMINNDENWSIKWDQYFDKYQNDLRHAHYIKSLLEGNGKILEIGAGSFRDSNYLHSIGYDIYGIDFCNTSVEKAKLKFPSFSNRISQMDAFNMKFEDNYFHTSFHNGFFVLFNDNEIKKLLIEQVRVTKDYLICTVHNAHNKKFVEYFDNLSLNDSLYNIRFFQKEEIQDIMTPFCENICIFPVGKQKKYHEDLLIKLGIVNPFILRNYIKFIGKKYINNSEKLICIGKIKK